MNLTPIEIPPKPKDVRFEVPAVLDGEFSYDIGTTSGTIRIFEGIGGEVTASRVAGALSAIGEKPVTVLVNSPGGSYFDGIAIFNLLRGHGKPVTAQVVGVAASAASLICMAASRIEMARNASMMIHDPWGIVAGNSVALEKAAAFLRKVAEVSAATYARRTGRALDHVKQLQAAETWMTAGEAISLGFADALLDQDAAPRLQTLQSSQPRSKRDLEAQLRHLGFAKAAAERVASAGWAALNKHDQAEAAQRLKARFDRLIQFAKEP